MTRDDIPMRLLCALLMAVTPILIVGCNRGSAHDPYAGDVSNLLGDRAVEAPPQVVAAEPAERYGVFRDGHDTGPSVMTTAWGGPSAAPSGPGLSAPPPEPAPADLAGAVSDAPPTPLWSARPSLRRGLEPGSGLGGAQIASADDAGMPMLDATDRGDAPAATPRRGEGPMARLASNDRPLDSFGETVLRDIKAAPRELWTDTKNIMTIENAIVLLAAGGASAMSRWVDADQSLDTTVAKHYDDHHSMPRDWNEAFGFLGNPAAHFGMAAAAYAYAVLAKDQKTYSVSKTMLSALMINGAATMALKLAVLDDRSPNGENFAWPSGHTSSAFTVAAVLEVSYGWKVGLPAYGIAALAGLQRMDTREHWLSDVIFGAALGIVIGRSVAKGRMTHVGGWSVLPYADGQGGGGVVLMKQR